MEQIGLNRLFLHACTIRFEHPKSGEIMVLSAPLDAELKQILKQLREMK